MATREVCSISGLPDELLGDIFLLAVQALDDTDEYAPLPHGFTSFEDEVLASIISVSRLWRNVAMNTPSLWTRTYVTRYDVIPDPVTEARQLDLSMVVRNLARSQQMPFDVLIDCRDPEWDFSEPEDVDSSEDDDPMYEHPFPRAVLAPLLDLLECNIDRLRSVAMLSDTYGPLHDVLARLASVQSKLLPHFSSLFLARCNDIPAHELSFKPAALFLPLDRAHVPFHGCTLPKLKSLVLCGVHTNWWNLPDILSGSTLRHLELSFHCAEARPSEAALRRILYACPGLKTLTMRVSGIAVPEARVQRDTPRDPPLLLPQLKWLALSYATRADLRVFLRLFSQMETKIRRLTLEGAPPPSYETVDVSDILTFWMAGVTPASPKPTPTFPYLTRLSLLRVSSSYHSLARVLMTHPRIRQVDVAGSGFALPVAEVLWSPLLYGRASCSYPCPSLRRFRVPDGCDFQHDELLRLIFMRSREDVTVEFSRDEFHEPTDLWPSDGLVTDIACKENGEEEDSGQVTIPDLPSDHEMDRVLDNLRTYKLPSISRERK
ncbi:hypothetical protein PUNSTDRAFT_137562 [Punctularia strigosozonata HHB-11173 SS5]|uniref:uncharacterized protein n=1 Tax=Punctularia strigosozonata (strain HHB-11173) TaxID=741275 RepID=UPI0004416C7F|nr:uncharacterized protein PUNSTDRAFT_137562 [Punctularia strigosozonata HHB-11173 SS5]EIN05448.1 hypothetical protein PUNSTDRAFT_137562 [Punctularia strigosozonata HHB-11173 SS5]